MGERCGCIPRRGWGGGVGRGCLALVSVPEFRSVGRIKGWALLRLFSRKLESFEERKTLKFFPSKSGALSPSGWGIFVSDEPSSPRDVCLGWGWGTGTSTYNLHTHMRTCTLITHKPTTHSHPYTRSHTHSQKLYIHTPTLIAHNQRTQLAYTLACKLSFHSHRTFTDACTRKCLVFLHRTFTLLPPHSFTSSIEDTPHKHSHTYSHTACPHSLFVPGGQKGQLPSDDSDRKKSPRKARPG